MTNFTSNLSKFRLSRRGRKLHSLDEGRLLFALPKEVPERIWAEILLKEENDLMVFEIREEILEEALRIGYERYMERMNTAFTVHCAAEAWIKLIRWHHYRHDPGEEAGARPACFIPKRAESWRGDVMPAPSPDDPWSRRRLPAPPAPPTSPHLEPSTSHSSLEEQLVEPIPQQYWFPGKVNIPGEESDSRVRNVESEACSRSEDQFAADSELLQRVTDYTSEGLLQECGVSPPDNLLERGAGDSTQVEHKKIQKKTNKHKVERRGRPRNTLPPLELKQSKTKNNIISDCKLRTLRLDTQYEISSEKYDSPQKKGKGK